MNCKKETTNTKCCLIMGLILFIISIIAICMVGMQSKSNILSIIAINGDNSEIGTTSIRFSKNEIEEGNALSHVQGSDEILINENGIYQISYQLYGLSKSLNTFNFNAVLLVNNIAIENTFNESPILRQNTENRMTLSGTVFLRLNAGDILKLQAVTIEDINYPRARMDIEKIA